MINILFFVLCLVSSSSSHVVGGMQSALKEDLELEQKLKDINKIPVKSIHTKFGYIVDCIDINKQPAFDHPLLKNHKLQRKPSFQKTIGKTNSNSSPAKPMIGLEKDQCPTGTVPIRRTTKDDLIRANSLLNNHILSQDTPVSHVAKLYLITVPDQPYYGVGGENSLYSLKVTKDQTSSSHIWVQNGKGDATSKILTGWHIHPQLYGDAGTHVYAYWSDNSKKTGCFNLQCPGFVQTDKEIYLGALVDNTSTYGGKMFVITSYLHQDPVTKNWWLTLENKNVGYFPAALFSNLTSADQVGWGGRTTTTGGAPSPPMGSGYFPDGDFVHACYFKNVTFLNAARQHEGPPEYLAEQYTDKPDCFGVKYYGYVNDFFNYALQFGGPGGESC